MRLAEKRSGFLDTCLEIDSQYFNACSRHMQVTHKYPEEQEVDLISNAGLHKSESMEELKSLKVDQSAFMLAQTQCVLKNLQNRYNTHS